MLFPSPEIPTAGTSTPPGAQTSQWGQFDDLFDRVFSLNQPTASPGSSTSSPPRRPAIIQSPYNRTHSGSPGGFASRGTIADDTDQSAMDDDWKEALKRVQKSTTTTTKRRIIRHTPTNSEDYGSPHVSPRPHYPRPLLHSDSRSATPDLPHTETAIFFPTHKPVYDDPEELEYESSASEGSKDLADEPEYLRRQISKFAFHEKEPEFKTVNMEMPAGLSKDQIQISFSSDYAAEKLTVSWQSVEITQEKRSGRVVRETKERKYTRTLPLPAGSRFEDIRAAMNEGTLSITYPVHPQGVPMERTVQILG